MTSVDAKRGASDYHRGVVAMTGASVDGWSAVCSGRLAESATEAVLAIADDLRGLRVADPSLTGQGGLAVLYSYLDRAFPEHGFGAVAEEHLAAAVSALAATPLRPALYGGFTGLAWCVEHICPSDAAAPPEDDPAAEIDGALLTALRRSPWPGEYDLIGGLVGLAVYAFERLPRASALTSATLILDRLEELARPQPGGIAWWSDPRFLPPGARGPDTGAYNLGVAHGVPGVIAVLARACALPELAPRARPLLDGAVAWLLAQRLAVGPGWFAYQAGEATPARTAWCYGDLGIAAALLSAARELGQSDWEQTAIDLAVQTLERPFELTGVRDAALCHGATGVAHLYNRLYQATGAASLGDATRWWFTRALEMRTPGVGVAGFVALDAPAPDRETWVADPSFLTGACGIALALLGATTTIAPDWDRVLLCAVAPSTARRSRPRTVPAGW